MKKISRWDAELSLKLAVMALGRGNSVQYIRARLKEVAAYLGDSNLPPLDEYFEQGSREQQP